MHELSLCMEVVEVLRAQQQQHGFQRVVAVGLAVGRWRAVEPSALELCFDAATRGTLAEGARLELRMVDPHAWCFACAERVLLAGEALRCPRCGGLELQLEQGDELRLTEIEVE